MGVEPDVSGDIVGSVVDSSHSARNGEFGMLYFDIGPSVKALVVQATIDTLDVRPQYAAGVLPRSAMGTASKASRDREARRSNAECGVSIAAAAGDEDPTMEAFDDSSSMLVGAIANCFSNMLLSTIPKV